MTVIPFRAVIPFRHVAVLSAVVLLATGCGLSEELERERDPGRTAPAEDPEAAEGGRGGVLIRSGMVEAAMGLRAMRVTLTNCGERAYRLNGYPKLRVLDEHRAPLDVQILEGPQPVTQLDDPGPHPVALKPGEAAHTSLVWRNTVTDTTTTAVSGTYLEVTPARGTRPGIVTPEGRIDLGNTGRIGTTAWQKTPADDASAARPTAPVPSTPVR